MPASKRKDSHISSENCGGRCKLTLMGKFQMTLVVLSRKSRYERSLLSFERVHLLKCSCCLLLIRQTTVTDQACLEESTTAV